MNPLPAWFASGGGAALARTELATDAPPPGDVQAVVTTMLDFFVRHDLRPQAERWPMSRINEALAHCASGKARSRIVQAADFA